MAKALQHAWCRIAISRQSGSPAQYCMDASVTKQQESTHIIADQFIVDHGPTAISVSLTVLVLVLLELLQQEPIQNAYQAFSCSMPLVTARRKHCPPLIDSTIQHLRRSAATESKQQYGVVASKQGAIMVSLICYSGVHEDKLSKVCGSTRFPRINSLPDSKGQERGGHPFPRVISARHSENCLIPSAAFCASPDLDHS